MYLFYNIYTYKIFYLLSSKEYQGNDRNQETIIRTLNTVDKMWGLERYGHEEWIDSRTGYANVYDHFHTCDRTNPSLPIPHSDILRWDDDPRVIVSGTYSVTIVQCSPFILLCRFSLSSTVPQSLLMSRPE